MWTHIFEIESPAGMWSLDQKGVSDRGWPVGKLVAQARGCWRSEVDRRWGIQAILTSPKGIYKHTGVKEVEWGGHSRKQCGPSLKH